ncbi:YHS domain-containing (seleno)protein [Devosia sp.]|uniref:YHS domain-containing (seleno)protein n=1 Tax=Devosia sp. TaxID=1871048 RepID=UPI003A92FFA0
MLLGGLLAPLFARAQPLVTAIVTDPLTGVALEGYDPVSYFVEADPRLGDPAFSVDWGGVPWFFSSAANRDVFTRHPEIYAPQFGGHCAMSLSRGFLSDGKARLYLIDQAKLYLFYSVANREAFLVARASARRRAAENWEELSDQLVGEEASTAEALESAAEQ